MHTRLYKNKNRGFTLIELLVVIAIIGILSSVVLASINTARSKARDSAVVASLKNMVSQAELYYDSSNSFTNLCTDPNMEKIVDSIDNTVSTAKCYVRSDGKSWAVSSAIKSDSSKNWSVDSNGVVAWDTSDTPQNNWYGNIDYCRSVGKRLPSQEQLIALNMVYNGLPPGFYNFYHWSGSEQESNNLNALVVHMGYAAPTPEDFTAKNNSGSGLHARCVY